MSRFCLLFAVLIVSISLSITPTNAQFTGSLEWTSQKLSDGRGSAGIPEIVADRLGGIHVFWPQGSFGSTPGALYYAHKKDNSSWLVNDVMVGNIQTPTAAIDDRGIIHLVWVEGLLLKYSYAPITEAASLSGWAKPVILADGIILTPDMLIDQQGNLHVAYTFAGVASAVYYIRSIDGGQRWSFPVTFDAPDSNSAVNRPQLAVGKDGRIHLVWSLTPSDSYYGGLGVYYSHSDDEGENWSNPIRLDERRPGAIGEQAWYASIAVVNSGEIHVVWDAHSQGGRRNHQMSRDGGMTWTTPEDIWGDFVYQTGPNPMILDSAGTLYLFGAGAFGFGERQGVYYSVWTGTNWTDQQLASISALGPEYIQVALTSGNVLHAVWQERGSEPQNVWYGTAQTSAPVILATPYIEENIQPSENPREPVFGENLVTPTVEAVTNVNLVDPLDFESLGTNVVNGFQSTLWVSFLSVTFFIGSIIMYKVFRIRKH